MRIRSTWESSLDFACHSKACAPPPVGTGGSRPKHVQSGAKVWWRMMGGSAEITTGAYDLMNGTDQDDQAIFGTRSRFNAGGG